MRPGFNTDLMQSLGPVVNYLPEVKNVEIGSKLRRIVELFNKNVHEFEPIQYIVQPGE